MIISIEQTLFSAIPTQTTLSPFLFHRQAGSAIEPRQSLNLFEIQITIREAGSVIQSTLQPQLVETPYQLLSSDLLSTTRMQSPDIFRWYITQQSKDTCYI